MSDDSGAPGNERGTNLESAGDESITAKRWRHKQLALSLSLPRLRAGRQFGIASTVSDLFVLVFFCSQSNLFLVELRVKSLSYRKQAELMGTSYTWVRNRALGLHSSPIGHPTKFNPEEEGSAAELLSHRSSIKHQAFLQCG